MGAAGSSGRASGGSAGASTGGSTSAAAGADTGPGAGSAGAPVSGGGAGVGIGGSDGAPLGGASGSGGNTTGAASGQAGANAGGSDGLAGAGGASGSAGSLSQDALPNVTVFLAGDSTVMAYGASSAQQGWGEHLAERFIPKVTVSNQALGGRSVKTFMYDDAGETAEAGRWSNIRRNMKAGDYVMIQFGINDSSAGSERFVTTADFKRLLGVMVDTIVAARATPILVTPSALQEWSNGRENNARLGPYAAAMKELAATKGVLVNDLNARSVEYLNSIGQVAAERVYYMGDKAHFTLYGAKEMARIVAEELLRVRSPLSAYAK